MLAEGTPACTFKDYFNLTASSAQPVKVTFKEIVNVIKENWYLHIVLTFTAALSDQFK